MQKRLKCADIMRQCCLSSQALAARQTQARVRQLTDAPGVVSLVVIIYWTADLKAQSCVVQGGGGEAGGTMMSSSSLVHSTWYRCRGGGGGGGVSWVDGIRRC